MHTSTLERLTPHLPLLIFLLPVVSINLAYAVASALEHIPQCIPYLSGCTSISSAGRIMPQKGLFLLGMIPAAILSVQFWSVAETWLSGKDAANAAGKTVSEKPVQEASRALLLTGAMASFFLLIYVSTLGIPGDFYRLLRKFGVLLYFGGTFIAQLLLVKRLKEMGESSGQRWQSRLGKRLEKFCVLVMACGIVIVPISLIEDPIRLKQLENVVEWNYALLIHIYYLALYPAWRRMAARHTNRS